MVIGPKYLTSGSVKDNKECRELGRSPMENSVARKEDRQPAVGEKGRSQSADAGSPRRHEKDVAFKTYI